jgi:hypothetical protein
MCLTMRGYELFHVDYPQIPERMPVRGGYHLCKQFERKIEQGELTLLLNTSLFTIILIIVSCLKLWLYYGIENTAFLKAQIVLMCFHHKAGV